MQSTTNLKDMDRQKRVERLARVVLPKIPLTITRGKILYRVAIWYDGENAHAAYVSRTHGDYIHIVTPGPWMLEVAEALMNALIAPDKHTE